MHVGNSLARAESSHARYDSVIITTQRSVNDETSKLPWCSRSRPHAPALSFAGLRARGAAVSPFPNLQIHITTQTERGFEDLDPCSPNTHVRSSASLGLVPWRSFAWKSSPALTRFFVQNDKRDTHTQKLALPLLCL